MSNVRHHLSTAPAIRLASPSDAGEIGAISRDYVELGLGWSWNYERVLAAIRDPETNVAVVGASSSLLAFAIMAYSEEDAHLQLLGVRRASQRKGVGSALVGWLEKVAVLAGVRRLLVETRATNDAARSFYLSNGYHLLSKEPGMYRNIEDGVRYQKWLRDV